MTESKGNFVPVMFVIVACAILAGVIMFSDGTVSGAVTRYAEITYNPTPTSNYVVPSGHVLRGVGSNFDRNREDGFYAYSDGTPIAPSGNLAVDNNHRYIIYFKTADVVGAGTNANIKFWKQGREYCIWNDMTGGGSGDNSPGWKVKWVKQCYQTKSGNKWTTTCFNQANINGWLADTGNNVICWYYN